MTLAVHSSTQARELAGHPAAVGRAARRPPASTASAEAHLVRAVRTPLTTAQAAHTLRGAWRKVFGREPSSRAIALVTAQWAHETGNGASMFNYNFGGIKGRGPAGLSVAQRTREGWGASERRIVDHFRAYSTAEQGAEDYLRLLGGRYASALGAAERGDAQGFVSELKKRGYFTGNEQAYAKSVTRLAHQAMAALGQPDAEFTRPAALGAAALPERVALSTASPPPPGVPSPGAAPASFSAMTVAQVLSLGDELSRAALKIAAPQEPRRG